MLFVTAAKADHKKILYNAGMPNHTTNVVATHCVDNDDSLYVTAGAYNFRGDPVQAIVFCCPCGCGDHYRLPIKLRDQPDRPNEKVTWIWNGDKEKPTLEPSIKVLEPGCKWHGHLVDGVFIPCSDSGK